MVGEGEGEKEGAGNECEDGACDGNEGGSWLRRRRAEGRQEEKGK